MRETVAEVDLSAIAFNLAGIAKKVSPAGIMAVVKADAYGHGAIPVSKVALQSGVQYLAVALVEEAIELRKAGIEAPILVLTGLQYKEAGSYVTNDLEATVYTRQMLSALNQAAFARNKTVRVHVKIDTGMGRVGVDWQDAISFFDDLQKMEGLRLYGIYTHFATSDMLDKSFANLQLSRFADLLEKLEAKGIKIPLKHTANSGAILDMPSSYFDLVRPGVMMYGYYPSTETTESLQIEPAMTFKTKVLYVKKIGRGSSVSYGRKFIAERLTTIATLPVGYADGYNRLLSNCGEVLIRGQRFPVAGRVCMDIIMVDLGPDSDVTAGEEAVLFGSQNGVSVSVQSICRKLNTIPYEVTCWVSKRVPRIYKGI